MTNFTLYKTYALHVLVACWNLHMRAKCLTLRRSIYVFVSCCERLRRFEIMCAWGQSSVLVPMI